MSQPALREIGPKETPAPPPEPESKWSKAKAAIVEWGKIAFGLGAIASLLLALFGFGASCFVDEGVSTVTDEVSEIGERLESRIDSVEESLQTQIGKLGEADRKIEADLGSLSEDVSYMSGVVDVIRDSVNALLARDRQADADEAADESPTANPR
ncbi:MAG: hypothetical protein F4228_13920 [Acidobacteria bacterium]|nr:hypothetical protein [Acidobacteriota bacterium]MYF15791.1 hypothetical protein [Acidobacteriota bacterium]MYI95910.1 hypothetical protein [Acidobacteriota bacterium]